MNYKLSYRISCIGTWVGIAIGVLGGIIAEIEWLGYLALVVILVSWAQGFKFYKCPHCGGQFNFNAALPTTCPHCGEKLE